jgi:hypothetical protein
MDDITVRGSVALDVHDLIQTLLDGLTREQLADFVLELDLRVADYEWTMNLRDRLTQAIAHEDIAWDQNATLGGE